MLELDAEPRGHSKEGTVSKIPEERAHAPLFLALDQIVAGTSGIRTLILSDLLLG